MNRDHMLGWPPAALYVDDPAVEPPRIRTYHKARPAASAHQPSVTPIRTRLTQAEQDQRRNSDWLETARLTAQLPPATPPRAVTVEDNGPPITLSVPSNDEWAYYAFSDSAHSAWRIRGSTAETASRLCAKWSPSLNTPERIRREARPVLRPSWDPELRTPEAQQAAPTREYRVRNDSQKTSRFTDIYTLSPEGKLVVWGLISHEWIPSSYTHSWDTLVPATPEQIAALPPEALLCTP